MTMRKLLCATIFCAGLVGLLHAQPKSDCSGFTASSQIRKSNVSDSFSTVSINVEGTKESVKCIFFKLSGQLVTDDFDKKTFDRVSKGDYRMIVVTASGCRKELQIHIE